MDMMKQVKRWIAVAVCVLASSTALAVASSGKPLARMANGELIGEQDLADYLERRMDLRGIARNVWGVEQVVREMALTRVLNLEGESLGIPRSGGGEATLRFDDAYGLGVQSKQEPVCERPANDREARKYFDENPQAFMVPAQARVQRMMLPVTFEIEGRPAMEWLKAQAQAIDGGGVQFAKVAQRAQDVYTLEPQGDLGWIDLEGDNAIVASLRAAKAGAVLGPLREGDFSYLFQVVSQRPARQLTWDESRAFAATQAVSYCQSNGREQLRARLFKKYGVEIDGGAIREFFARTIWLKR